ncbi:MAG: peptidase M64 N-terminal domain-containing protein, partial [Bacteroidales bacterium]
MLFLCISLLSFSARSAVNFDDYFYNRTLRIDYIHTGAYHEDSYSIDELRSEPHWGGSKVNLIDTMN